MVKRVCTHNNPSTSTVEGLLAYKTGSPCPISIQCNSPDNNQKTKNKKNQKHDFIVCRVRKSCVGKTEFA